MRTFLSSIPIRYHSFAFLIKGFRFTKSANELSFQYLGWFSKGWKTVHYKINDNSLKGTFHKTKDKNVDLIKVYKIHQLISPENHKTLLPKFDHKNNRSQLNWWVMKIKFMLYSQDYRAQTSNYSYLLRMKKKYFQLIKHTFAQKIDFLGVK